MTRSKRTANVEKTADPLADYPAEYAECRTDLHDMGPAQWHAIPGQKNHAHRIRMCRRCARRVVELIDLRTFDRVDNAQPYSVYPRGYLTPVKGARKSDFRTRHLRAEFEAQAGKK